jgi:hypothetical protein
LSQEKKAYSAWATPCLTPWLDRAKAENIQKDVLKAEVWGSTVNHRLEKLSVDKHQPLWE